MHNSPHTYAAAQVGRVLICSTLLFLLVSPAARAQTTYGWTGSLSTDWFATGNWSPSGVPTSADDANIDLSSGPIVASTGATASQVNVGNTATGSLIIQAGGSINDSTGYIGNNTGSNGTTTITGMGSSWINSGDLFVGTNSGSSGTLTVENGGTVTNAFGDIGADAGSTGIVTVTGIGSSWTNSNYFVIGDAGSGTLTVESGGSVTSNDALFIGANGGGGTLTVESGGTISDTTAYIGTNVGSTGTVTVTGTGSNWTNSSDLFIGNAGSGTLTISSAGNVSSAGTVYIANGSGSTGTLNIGAASGSPAAAPGTLTTSTVVFGAGTGALVFNHTSSNYVFTPAISGNGAIDLLAGTTVLSGNSSGYTGTATVSSGGVLETDGNLAGTINLASGGKLQGTGTLGNSLSLSSGAMIAPGTRADGSIGTLTVNGNYTQSSGATTATTISPSAAGKLAVSGTASLGGSLLLIPTAGNYIRGTSYDILTSNSVSGTFASVTNTASSIATFGITYTGTSVVLTTESGITSFTTTAGTSNQRNIGQALDRVSSGISSGNFNTILNTLTGFSSADQQQALNQLDSTIATGLQSGASGTMHAVFGSIAQHLANNSSDGDITLASDFGPNGEVQVADASSMYWGPDRTRLSDYTVWMQGFGQSASLGSDSTGLGMSSTWGGVTFGLEWQPTRESHLGFAFGTAETAMSINETEQSSKQGAYVAGLYGSHDWDQLVLDGAVLLGYSHVTTQRQIAFLSEQASGATDGYGAGADVGLGYRINLDEDDTTLTPHVGLNYTYNKENSYTETGAPGADLAIASGNQHLLQSSVGATLVTKFLLTDQDGAVDILRPQLSLAWRHDILDPSASVNEAFAGVASSSFTTISANPGRDAANIGLGVSLTPGNMPTFALYVRYDGSFSANEIANEVTGGVKYSW